MPTTRALWSLLLALGLGLAGCHPDEQKATSASEAPGVQADGRFEAKTAFATKCSGCHGANGGGGMGPSLSQVAAKGDAFIRNRITNGSPENGMPAFGPQLSPAEIGALVQYVKTL